MISKEPSIRSFFLEWNRLVSVSINRSIPSKGYSGEQGERSIMWYLT
jgi:hypothetical protein